MSSRLKMLKVAARGNSFFKHVDKVLGGILVYVFLFIKSIRVTFSPLPLANESSIGICCYGAIGDLILVSECLAALKEKRPSLNITLFCTSSNKSVSDLYAAVYDHVCVVPLTQVNPLRKQVLSRKIDTVIDCNQWVNISLIHCLSLKILAPAVFIRGFAREKKFQGYDQITPHNSTIHELVNYYNLILNQTFNSNDDLPEIIPRLFEIDSNHNTNSNILIHMWPSGTRSYLKEWPESNWLKVCDYLMRQGYTLYISGAPADKERNMTFTEKLSLNSFIDLAGKKSLKELSDFIKQEISVTISVNTGILHLSYLAGSAVLGIHGPTNPLRWGPIGSRSLSLLPEKGKFAYLNYGFEYPKDDTEAYSLQYLNVPTVIEAFNKLISRS